MIERTETRLEGGSLMVFPDGEISGRLTPIAVDARVKRAVFELRVDNATSMPIAAFAYAPGKSAGPVDWHSGIVDAYSTLAVRIDLPFAGRSAPGAVASLIAGDAALTLEAAPPVPRRRAVARRAVALATATAVLGLAGAAVASTRPAILAIAAPDHVMMGKPFTLDYAATHTSGLTYAVRAPSGHIIRHGNLTGGTGSVGLELPLTKRSIAYDVVVEASGTFGTDRRIVRVDAARPAAKRSHRRPASRTSTSYFLSL